MRLQLQLARTIIVIVVLTFLWLPAFAVDPPHNQAEGDNPALNEKVLQDELKKNSKASETVQKIDSNSLFSTVENLVKEYYPKAKIKRCGQEMHVEFKARPYILPSTNKEEKGPDWGGLVFDMNLQNGPYAGVHQVPKKFNEYSFYHVELFAPYSAKFDCHLLSRVCYPFDVQPEFLKRFKKLIEDFEQFLSVDAKEKKAD